MVYDVHVKEALVRATRALRYETAAHRVLLAARALRDELRYNPNWRLQPRVLTGSEAGQWTDGLGLDSRQPGSSLLVAAKTKDFDYACRALKVNPHRQARLFTS